MTKNIKISVIVPTCNRVEMLDRCLTNLKAKSQSLAFSEYEVIVTDDSNNDFCRLLVEEKYNWVTWVQGPKKGPAANRNNGAKHAKGEWLAFTDDDCIPSYSWLSAYVYAFSRNKVKIYEGLTRADKEKERFDEEAPINLVGGNLWSCNFCVEKQFYFEIGGFDENFPFPAMEDVDFHIRSIKLQNIIFVNDAEVIHPLRITKPFRGYKKWLLSNKYIQNKHGIKRDLSYRFVRTKIFIGDIYYSFKELHGYSYRGAGFYAEKALFNFLMIIL